MDGSEWRAANTRRKDNTSPKPPPARRKIGRKPSTPNKKRMESPPCGPQDHQKVTVGSESSQDTNREWEVKGRRRSRMRPEVHIYPKTQRHSLERDVAAPKALATRRPPRAERRHSKIHKKHTTAEKRRSAKEHSPKAQPTKSHEDPGNTLTLGELLSEERANKPPAEKQGVRHDIQDYRRMMSIAAETSRELQKNEGSKNLPLPKDALVASRRPTKGAPPICEFPLHPYFTESPDRVPDPSDLAGDPYQFWLGVHHLTRCMSLAHSALMVGVCKVLCEVFCTRRHNQDYVSGALCF